LQPAPNPVRCISNGQRKDRYLAPKKPTRTKSGASASAAKRASAKKTTTKSTKNSTSRKSAAKKPASSAKRQSAAPARALKPASKPAVENKALKIVLASLNEMKAQDVVTIDLSDKNSIGETMVVTTGRSNVHVASIADRVVKDLKANGITGVGVEGLRQGDWVLIDTGGVIVHVFRPEVREFYNIEKMWSA
jgi:ribosome-associated protein